jgi:pimeloyl-ACP methyl ester carboxylesterase
MKVRSFHHIAHLFSKGAVLLALISTVLLAAPARSAELTSHFAEFDGIKVHYQASGKGKEALIFVHGWTCNSDFWRGQTSAFPETRVIAVDLPGHGRSDQPQTDYTMAYFARSIEAVMRDARVTRAVLVGHSMGAPIVRQFYRLYPDKTLALVIVDGGLKSFATKEQMAQFTTMLRTNYKAVAQPMVEGMVKPIKDEKLKEQIRASMQATPEHVAVSAMVNMGDEKLYEKDPIKVPLLAVLAKSPLWPPDTEQFLLSLAPNLEFYMWDNVSHFLMMEKPQEFNQTLRSFLIKKKLLKLK